MDLDVFYKCCAKRVSAAVNVPLALAIRPALSSLEFKFTCFTNQVAG